MWEAFVFRTLSPSLPLHIFILFPFESVFLHARVLCARFRPLCAAEAIIVFDVSPYVAQPVQFVGWNVPVELSIVYLCDVCNARKVNVHQKRLEIHVWGFLAVRFITLETSWWHTQLRDGLPLETRSRQPIRLCYSLSYGLADSKSSLLKRLISTSG